MQVNSCLLETSQRIAKLPGSTKRKCIYNYVLWILSRYVHYALEAVIHGYPIKVYYRHYKPALIQFVYTPVVKTKKHSKIKYLYSSRVFGNMFFILITGRFMKNNDYHFFLEKGLRDRITEIINTDTVYQYLKT